MPTAEDNRRLIESVDILHDASLLRSKSRYVGATGQLSPDEIAQLDQQIDSLREEVVIQARWRSGPEVATLNAIVAASDDLRRSTWGGVAGRETGLYFNDQRKALRKILNVS